MWKIMKNTKKKSNTNFKKIKKDSSISTNIVNILNE